MLTVFITSNQIPLHAVFCHNNYYIIIVFPLHIIMYVHVHCIQLARGMMRMRIPSRIKDGAVICTVQRLSGGGVGLPPGLSFVDIDADAAPKAISWAKTGPRWRVAKPGLCIEGVCKKRGCRAFRKTVVMNFGFTYLNLVSRSHECLCPECRGHVEPDTCAFNNCYWKIFGQKRESPEQSPTAVVIPERHADDVYHRFESETSGKAQWLSLVLITYKSNAEYCWDCCKPVLSGDETRFPCCHVTHRHCTTRSSSCRRCSTGTSPFQKSHSIN